jgi:hypothetical protein
MIDTLQLATLGLAPGWSTFNVATMGYGFEIEVVISPPVRGSGELEVIDVSDSRRLVTVTVHFRGHSWKSSLWIETIILNKVSMAIRTVSVISKEAIRVIVRMKSKIRDAIIVSASPK